MLASINEQEIAELNKAIERADEIARERLGDDYPEYHVTWSERLTSAAGNARKDGTIKLSAKIARQSIKDLGITGACLEWQATLLHEIAHVVCWDGHGSGWRSAMRKLGLSPENYRYHSLKCGSALNSDSSDWYRGQHIHFWNPEGGVIETAVILRTNVKTVSVHSESWGKGRVSYGLLIPDDELADWQAARANAIKAAELLGSDDVSKMVDTIVRKEMQ